MILKDSPLDPVADLVVRRVVDINWTERASTQVGQTVERVRRVDAAALHAPALRRPVGARKGRVEMSPNGELASNDRYMIVSADGHAGLVCEDYRPYLDPQFSEPFDEYLAGQANKRADSLAMNYDYIMHWETEHAEGLRGAFDAEQRDKELDADGVAAEVIFADADAITGNASPPFGAGLSAGEITDPELAFAGATRTTVSSWSCARTARSGAPASGWCRSATTWCARSRRSSGSPNILVSAA